MADEYAGGTGQVGNTTTTTRTTTGSPPIGLHPEFIKTIPGILKIAEMALSMATFICAAVWGGAASGWVQFVSMSAFLLCLIMFVFHLANLIYKVPHRTLIWFVYFATYSLFYIIAACVAIGFAAQHDSSSACEATAVFASFTTPVFCFDTYLQFGSWRRGDDDIQVTTTTTVSMTTVPKQDSRAEVY